MNKQDKDAVVKKIKENHERLKDFGILKVGIFGSFARGQASKASDIDLLVKFAKEKKTYRNFIGFADFIEQLLGRKVEVVTEESLSPYIAPYVKKEVEYV